MGLDKNEFVIKIEEKKNIKKIKNELLLNSYNLNLIDIYF